MEMLTILFLAEAKLFNCCSTYLGTQHELLNGQNKIEIMRQLMKHCVFRLARIIVIILGLYQELFWYLNNQVTFFHLMDIFSFLHLKNICQNID